MGGQRFHLFCGEGLPVFIGKRYNKRRAVGTDKAGFSPEIRLPFIKT